MESGNNIENLVRNYRVPSEKERGEIWNSLKTKIGQAPAYQTIPLYRRRSFLLAASVLFAALVFSVLADPFLTTKKYYAGAGTQQQISLPDSSQVTLNPRSELTVKYSFITGKRNLTLRGEALFDVNPGAPFTVKFDGGKVQVLGTVFTVEAYKNCVPIIQCLEGSVAVTTRQNQVVLTPERGVALKSCSVMEPVTVIKEAALAEINGIFNWESEPLETIFEKLENRFGYHLVAAQEIRQRHFSGMMKMQELPAACETVAFAMDLKYRIDEESKTIVFESTY
jgi:transmembrane sensor